MYLQLAENYLSAKPKRVQVNGYKRRANVPAHTRKFPKSLAEAPQDENPYIFIPDFEQGNGGIFVRDDKFDYLPADQYSLFLQLLAPYQPNPEAWSEDIFLHGFFKTFFKNREERKQKRQERRSQRAESKSRAREAKILKASRGEPSVLDKIIDGATSIFGKKDDTTDTTAPGATDTTPFYKKPIFLIGGAVLLAGGIYLATKKK